MKLLSSFLHSSRPETASRFVVLALGTVIFGGAGTLIVRAADNPEILKVMQEFNRPIRRAVEPYVPRPNFQLPQMFRARNFQPVQALGYAPQTQRLHPPLQRQPTQLRHAAIADENASINRQDLKSRPRLSWGGGRGAPVATNYCVRLCDGFAFPVGNVGTGAWTAQETACRSACPGAQTALFSAPAGARDFDTLSRGGLRYSTLQNAFQYREKISDACSCRPVGATQSTAALLADVTLRRGDIVMTRIGARHFDGTDRFPYRAAHFSDALTKLTSKNEIAIVRAMEVASVRGILSVKTPTAVRNRVVTEIRQAERIAARTPVTSEAGLARGFVEIRARERRSPVMMPIVRRAPGLVALN